MECFNANVLCFNMCKNGALKRNFFACIFRCYSLIHPIVTVHAMHMRCVHVRA